MSTKRFVAITFALSLFAPSLARASERIQAGLWEVTAAVEVPGLAQQPPPTKQTACISQKDAESDPVPELDKSSCRVRDIQRSGDKVTWKVDCGQLGKGEGEIVYKSPTAYDGWMRLEASGTILNTTLRARRIGGC